MAEISQLTGIIGQLPELFFLSDVIFYLFGTLFYGSIAVKGYRGYMHFLPHFGLRVLAGFISMMGGLALRGLFPSLNQGIYQLFRADILAGSLISSIALAGGLFLISYRLLNVNSLKGRIEKMEKRMEMARKLPPEKRGWKDPLKIAGVAVFIAVVAVAVANFRGFPSVSEGLLDMLGLTMEDIRNLESSLEPEMPPGCQSVISLLQPEGGDLTKLQRSSDQDAARVFEGQGKRVLDMRVSRIEGTDYFLAVTEDQMICSATRTQFCSCLDPSQFTP